MSEVRRQQRQLRVNIDSRAIPAEQCIDCKGMAKIMDSRSAPARGLIPHRCRRGLMQYEMPVPVYARPPRVAFQIKGVSGDDGSFSFARAARHFSISFAMPS